MDWFRRMFGFPDRRSYPDDNPFRNPTWEEIMGNRDRMEPPHMHRPGVYDDFFGPGGPEDHFTSVFGQMDSMFQQLDAMMQGLQQHPGHFVITEEPENPSEKLAPRDFMLKAPDSDLAEEPGLPQDRPLEGESQEGHQHWGPHGFSGGFGGFGGFHGGIHGGLNDPFHMMEEFFHNFGRHFGGPSFEGPHGGGPPMLPGPGMDHSDSNRDSVLKEDSDLDDRVSGGLSQLLKEGPQYDSLNPPAGNTPFGPPDGGQLQPGIQRRFHSSTITRIRRPDGSIEETRKYRDSTGREEEVVTHYQPETEASPGGLLKPGEGGRDGPEGGHHATPGPSIFSWLFTR